jgi:hypothetical protein
MRKIFYLFLFFNFSSFAQNSYKDTLWEVSPKLFIYTNKAMKSNPRHSLAISSNGKFSFNNLSIKYQKIFNYCRAHYSEDIKRVQEKYQKKIQQGISIEKADSFILYKLTRYAGSYHKNDFFYSWGVYDKLAKFDKLQGKYHYIDYHTAYKKRQPIYRKDYWKRDTEDSIYVYDCSIERYLLVDSVIYLFTSTLREPHRNRKRGLRILEREFKQFVRCIWVKEEEELLEE